MAVDKSHTGDEYNAIMTAVKALSAYESLESEYKAYHTNSDYWRGVRYALDMMGGGKNDHTNNN